MNFLIRIGSASVSEGISSQMILIPSKVWQEYSRSIEVFVIYTREMPIPNPSFYSDVQRFVLYSNKGWGKGFTKVECSLCEGRLLNMIWERAECSRPHFVINAGERDAKSLGLLSRQGRDVRLYEGFRWRLLDWRREGGRVHSIGGISSRRSQHYWSLHYRRSIFKI